MAFEVEHKNHIIIVADHDRRRKRVAIEDVVNPDTGEVVTNEWFKTLRIRDDKLYEKILNKSRQNSLNNFL